MVNSVEMLRSGETTVQVLYRKGRDGWYYTPRIDGDGKERGPFPTEESAGRDALRAFHELRTARDPFERWRSDPKVLRLIATISPEDRGKWCVLAVVQRGSGFEDTNMRYVTQDEALAAIGQPA